jgi:hypothetical protein
LHKRDAAVVQRESTSASFQRLSAIEYETAPRRVLEFAIQQKMAQRSLTRTLSHFGLSKIGQANLESIISSRRLL